ncbi:hypothetical protein Gotur_023807 [Gossypium turneri]
MDGNSSESSRGGYRWRAPWMLPDEILYRCMLRQYRSRQFVPATQGLAQCEFSYKDDGYKKKIREMANAWNQTRWIKRLVVGPIATPKYIEWWGRRINDNISGPKKKIEQIE